MVAKVHDFDRFVQVPIKLTGRNTFLRHAFEAPSYVWAMSSKYKLNPVAFSTSANEATLNPIQYSAEAQLEMLRDYVEDPLRPRVILVTSSPNDDNATAVALRLCEIYMSKSPPNVIYNWVRLGYSRPDASRLFDSGTRFLVVSAVSPVTHNSKLEFIQELIDNARRTDSTIVVVGTGMNPVELAALKLFRKSDMHLYYCTKLIKNNIEVL